MTTPDSDDRLDPAAERVLRRMRRFAAFSGLIMLLGFLAVFGAIGYKLIAGRKSAPAEITGTLQLPRGADVRSVTVSGDLIAVTVAREGRVETHFFDLATRAPRGVLGFASAP